VNDDEVQELLDRESVGDGFPDITISPRGYFATFADGQTWPLAGESAVDIEGALRHGGELSRSARLIAASIVAAYRELVMERSGEERGRVVAGLREAERVARERMEGTDR
jgi:hypothetical protein